MSVGSYNIEIPHPVIEVEVDFEPAINHGENSRWFARVEIGGVTLMKREYQADWPDFKRPDDFAEDGDEARRMILAEFGKHLKSKLFDGEGN
jgi:hypothetical protein